MPSLPHNTLATWADTHDVHASASQGPFIRIIIIRTRYTLDHFDYTTNVCSTTSSALSILALLHDHISVRKGKTEQVAVAAAASGQPASTVSNFSRADTACFDRKKTHQLGASQM